MKKAATQGGYNSQGEAERGRWSELEDTQLRPLASRISLGAPSSSEGGSGQAQT